MFGIENRKTRKVVWTCSSHRDAVREWHKRCKRNEYYRKYYKVVSL
jgi:hypothetical protein